MTWLACCDRQPQEVAVLAQAGPCLGVRAGHWTLLPWGTGMGWLPLFILLLAAVVAAIVVLRAASRPPRDRDALEILRERFARGEIDVEEYERRRAHVTGDLPPA